MVHIIWIFVLEKTSSTPLQIQDHLPQDTPGTCLRGGLSPDQDGLVDLPASLDVQSPEEKTSSTERSEHNIPQYHLRLHWTLVSAFDL